jgi:hypothetical protein
MTSQELYEVYAAWTGSLHFWTNKHLGRHIDCEFFPNDWLFKLYTGHAQDAELMPWGFSTVPALQRPPGEAKATITLPKPEDNPTQEQLDEVFRGICLAAASILEIDLDKPKLPEPPETKKRGTPQLRLKKPKKCQ